MKDVKQILSENRESIISSIKWTFKIYKMSDVKVQMINFLEWAENNESEIIRADEARNTKTLLKSFIMRMAYIQNTPTREAAEAAKRDENIKLFGKAKPKLEDIMGKRAEQEEARGNVWHPIYKEWVKDEGFNPTMRK